MTRFFSTLIFMIAFVSYAKAQVNVSATHSVTGITNITATGTATLGGNAYPSTAGTNGQVLKTDGAGVLSWVTPGEPTYTIGLWPELGGYIFRISADGKHGLVAETQNQSAVSEWYDAQNVISNPANHSKNGQKYMDWRMPTKYELNEMYLARVAIGGFGGDNYWSSSEIDFYNAWYQIFANGNQNYNLKDFVLYVRAVRVF